jgi:hypothetical protein
MASTGMLHVTDNRDKLAGKWVEWIGNHQLDGQTPSIMNCP